MEWFQVSMDVMQKREEKGMEYDFCVLDVGITTGISTHFQGK